MTALEAAQRELQDVQQQVGAPLEPRLGCSRIAHDRLGFCTDCASVPTPRVENIGWQLLALIEREASR